MKEAEGLELDVPGATAKILEGVCIYRIIVVAKVFEMRVLAGRTVNID